MTAAAAASCLAQWHVTIVVVVGKRTTGTIARGYRLCYMMCWRRSAAPFSKHCGGIRHYLNSLIGLRLRSIPLLRYIPSNEISVSFLPNTARGELVYLCFMIIS